jgi:2-methylcitrate dehydratase PrpD
VKPHACCRYNHAAIDALLELVTRHDLGPADIAGIRADVPLTALPIVAEPAAVKRAPANVVDAQFSLPYALAVAVRHRRASPAEYAEPVRDDPEVRRLMGLVECHGDPVLEALFPASWPARVTVRTAAGRRHEASVRDPRGSPKNPLGRDGVSAQARALLDGVLPAAAVDALIDATARLDALPDLARLTAPLAALAAAGRSAP